MEQKDMGGTNAIDLSAILAARDANTEANPESSALTRTLQTQDLIQRFEQLVATCNQMIDRFQDVEPNIDVIYHLRDKFESLEQRTVSIVNQFQNEIYIKEDQADQIVNDLNNEVNRVQENIQDLLGLSKDFDSISEEINRLLEMDERTDVLEELVDELQGSTKVINPGPGEGYPIADRKPDSVYLITDSEHNVPGVGTVRYTTYEDHEGRKYYFKTNSDQVDMQVAGTKLFTASTTLSQFITRLDTILSKKVYVTTYYANLTTNYSGSAAPFSQRVSVPGIKSSDEPFVGCINSDTNPTVSVAQSKAFGNISRVHTADNAITVYCDKKKPEAALNLRLVVFRTD